MPGSAGTPWREVWRLGWRAVCRRCPRCGQRGIWTSFTRTMPACPNCHLVLDRGESDYFYGAYMLNFVAAELVALGAFAIGLLITWPDPPWNVLLYGTAVIAVIAPFMLYPTSKALWLALDLALRPGDPR